MTATTHQLRLRIFVLFLLGLTAALASPATARADRVANARYNQLARSVVLTEAPMGNDTSMFGTAWLVDKRRGWLMTAYHCTAGKSQISVYFPQFESGRLITTLKRYGQFRPTRAKVIATDEHRDLAVIQVASVPSYFQPLKISDAAPAPGETVYTLGNPVSTEKVFQFRQAEVLRFGFSALDAQNTGMTVTGDFLTVQGNVISGFSGGAMINASGEVVGVAAASLNDTQNVGYIAHTELRKFFGLDDRYTRVADPARPMVGDWILSVYENDKRTGQGGISFTADGQYTMSKLIEYQSGRYAHIDGNTLVIRAADADLEKWPVKWEGKHRFSAFVGDQVFVFDRYGTLKMETNS